MQKKKITKLFIITILAILLLVTLIPLWWCIVMAFDRSVLDVIPNPPSMWPEQFSTFNFEYAFKMVPMLKYFFNTTFITIVNTVISVFFALMAGYAFAKGKFHLKKLLFLFMIAVMMIPFEARMVPLFLQYKRWGMLNTYLPLILGNFAYVYGIFFAKQNIENLPDSLREAAFIDGAGEWRIFLTIIIPLSGPLIATLCILQVLANWNSFIWPLIIISSKGRQLISVGVSLFSASQYSIYFGPRMAVAVVSAIPLVIMFLFLQKYIVASIALSGIKQ